MCFTTKKKSPSDETSNKKSFFDRFRSKKITIYTVKYREELENGQIKYTFITGDKYIGNLLNDKPNGKGIYYFESDNIKYLEGSVYEGDFKDGIMSGKGKCTFKNGDYYVGDFDNFALNGKGVFYYVNSENRGDQYEGDFKDGLKHGHGTYIYSNGDKYIGNFKNGKKDGLGCFTFASGQIYEGAFKNDVKEGYGTYYWKNGDKYVGSFSNDKMDGPTGFISYANGNIYKGSFSNGKFYDGILYDKVAKCTKIFQEGELVKELSDSSAIDKTEETSK